METISERFLLALGRNSAEAAMLVLVVLAVQRLFARRTAPRWRCALWLLVMARLLLPVSIGSVVSLFNLVPRLKTPPPARLAETPPKKSSTIVAPTAPTAPIPGPGPKVGAAESSVRSAAPVERFSESVGYPTPATPGFAVKPLPPTSNPVGISRWPAVFYVWICGVAFFAGYVLLISFRIRGRLTTLAPVTDTALLELARECRERLGVRNGLALAESPEVASPALYGFLKPVLLLPPGFASRFSANELRFILLHELAHVKRRDILFNWLAAALQIVHWFNPLIWFAFARWRTDREPACDAIALEAAGADQNQEYGRTILRLVENFTPRTAVPGLVGILEDKKQIQQRIRLIAGFRPGRKFGRASAALFASIGLIGLTDAQLPKPISVTKHVHDRKLGGPPAPATEIQSGTNSVPADNATNAALRKLIVTVTDTETGIPIPDAEISLSYDGIDNAPRTAHVTNHRGRCVLWIPAWLQPNPRRIIEFFIYASHSNYATHTLEWRIPGAGLTQALPEEVAIGLEHGVTIGAVVLDARGAPVAGVRVLLSGADKEGFYPVISRELESFDYSEVNRAEPDAPAAITSSSGRWTFPHFPSDLDSVTITLIRPDESREIFSTLDLEQSALPNSVISMNDLRAINATFPLPDGVTVRGLVVDESGHPLSGVTIQEGYGYHQGVKRVSESKTDSRGHFERFNRAPRQWIYTATAADRATVSIVAQVKPDMPEVRIVMPPARPLKFRMIEEDGKPVPRVGVSVASEYVEGQILDWKAKTDAAGLVIWSNAPLATLLFSADHPTLGKQEFKANASDGEKIVIWRKWPITKATVQVTARDANSGAPLKLKTVGVEYDEATFKTLARPNDYNASVEVKEEDFQEIGIRIGMTPTYRVRVEAEGYRAYVTDRNTLAEGSQKIAAAMTPGDSLDATAFLPDGKPAAGARIWVKISQFALPLWSHGPGLYYEGRLAIATADHDGRFTLPVASGDPAVVVTADNGFLETTAKQVQNTHEARLQPWGRVEGVLMVAGQPKGGAEVHLQMFGYSQARGFLLTYNTWTDPDGRFTFEQVPAGEYELHQFPGNPMVGRGIPPVNQMPFIVKAGETTKIEYKSVGRAVIGRAVADKSAVVVNWTLGSQTLTLRQSPIPSVHWDDFASSAALRKANDEYEQTSAYLQHMREARSYELRFERDGSFTAVDVPPGAYELRISVIQPRDDHESNARISRAIDKLGSLTREIVVPPGDGPFDLGTVVVPVNAPIRRIKRPVPFVVQALDGTPISLAQFRDQYVLLAFWDVRSDSNLERLADLQRLQMESTHDGRIVFVGACINGDATAIQKVADERGYHWTQTRLSPADLAEARETFDVDTLPAICLIDPDGQIIARNLSGYPLRVAVNKALHGN